MSPEHVYVVIVGDPVGVDEGDAVDGKIVGNVVG